VEPVTIAIIIISSLLMVAVWPYIVDYLSVSVIPWIREHWGETYAYLLAEFVTWLDRGCSVARAKLRDAWQFFQSRVLRMKATYTKVSATSAKMKTETILATPGGKVVRKIEEQEVTWEDLPPEIRNEMIRQNSEEGVIDFRDAFAKRVKERASKEAVELEMAMS
jgi:hypothetical protein